MERQTFHLAAEGAAASSLGNWLQVYPLADYEERWSAPGAERLTLGGRLTRAQVGCGVKSVSFGLAFVASADQATLTSWWLSRAALLLAWDLTSPGSMSFWGCQLGNQLTPVRQQHVPGQGGYYRGMLQLVPTYTMEELTGLPFTYDDASLGLLDQAYNPQLP